MREAIESLLEKYQRSVYAVAFNVCRNVQDAEDVTQDTFVQYLSRGKEYQSEEHIRAWLLRVAINKAKNRCMSLFRRSTVPLEDYMDTLSFETEEASELLETVMGLPEKYRLVIHLFYYEDYSVSEIAAILKLSESNVKVRLSRGRAQLRDALKEAWDNDES